MTQRGRSRGHLDSESPIPDEVRIVPLTSLREPARQGTHNPYLDVGDFEHIIQKRTIELSG